MACNKRKPRKLPTKREIPTKRPRGFVILCAALLVILFGMAVRRAVIVANIPRYRDVAVVTPEPAVTPVPNRAEIRIAYNARREQVARDKPALRTIMESAIVLDESKALWNRPGSEVLKEWLGSVIGVGPARGPPARGARPRLHIP